MNKAKTNALDALRALIAERQQYEQWISVLEAKRDGTPAHVFEKVNADYETRMERVSGEIGGHAEELQLNITTLSSRLIEVARDEDTRKDALQEAELRAAVGEYDPARWEEIRVESQRDLDRIAVDRERLDNELAELRSIQTLSAVGPRSGLRSTPQRTPSVDAEALPESDSGPSRSESAVAASPARVEADDAASRPGAIGSRAGAIGLQPDDASLRPDSGSPRSDDGVSSRADAGDSSRDTVATRGGGSPASSEGDPADRDALPSQGPGSSAEPAAATSNSIATGSATIPASVPETEAPSRQRSMRTPLGGTSGGKSGKQSDTKGEQSKTLKCHECGTLNHPTEWYCERCGGELATM
ncbi:MAG: hypothetical protein WKF55_15265 [Gemmatimonadaceae bacterium]